MGILDYLVIIVYFGFVLGIGFYLQRFANTGEEFFMAGREMTAWVALVLDRRDTGDDLPGTGDDALLLHL
jgi:Na+/proline symporter